MYAPLFLNTPELALVAAADNDGSLLEGFSRDFGVRAYTDWRRLLGDDDVQVVLIFLPHSDCPEAGMAAAEAGKHIIVEKPVASTSQGVRSVVDAASAHGVKFSTPYIWRYDPAAMELKRLVQSGALGTITACEGRCAAGKVHRYYRNASWMLEKAKSGGGAMHNLGVHWIDLFRWMLEDDIVGASGEVSRTSRNIDVEENSFALLKFSRGAVAVLDISYSLPDSYPGGRDLYISLRGTKGAVSWVPAWEGDTDEVMLCTEAGAADAAGAQSLEFKKEPVPGYGGTAGVKFLQDFARCILEDRPPAISGEDAVVVLEVVEAIYASAETGTVMTPGEAPRRQ